MADKQTKSVRLDRPTLDRLADYQDDHDLNESDALRRALDAGLTAHGYPDEPGAVTDGRGGFGGWVESTARQLLGVFMVAMLLAGAGATALLWAGFETAAAAAGLLMVVLLVLGVPAAVAMLAGALAQGHDAANTLPWRAPR